MSLCLTAVSLPILIFVDILWNFAILQAKDGREYSSGECMTTMDTEHMFVESWQAAERRREDDTEESRRIVGFCVQKC